MKYHIQKHHVAHQHLISTTCPPRNAFQQPTISGHSLGQSLAAGISSLGQSLVLPTSSESPPLDQSLAHNDFDDIPLPNLDEYIDVTATNREDCSQSIPTLEEIEFAFAKTVFQSKIENSTSFKAANQSVLAGFNLAFELQKSNQLSAYNVGIVNDLAGSAYRQKSLVNSINSRQYVEQREIVGDEHVWYYLPVEETILNLILVGNRKLLHELILESERRSQPGLFIGSKDGTVHQQERENEIRIKIDLYIDDFQDMTGVYFVINNLPYYLQSNRREVQLAVIGTKKTFKKVGQNRFLRPLFLDLRTLFAKQTHLSGQKYLTFDFNVFVGDNKALNEMMAITSCFFRTQACRFCLCSYAQIQTVEQFQLFSRARSRPPDHVLSGVVDSERPMIYGIDIYHDMIEGICGKFLFYLIKKNYTRAQISTLNNLIQLVDWQIGRINNISPRSSSFSYHSGMAFFEFFVKFSYLDFICKSDSLIFKMYISLRKILNTVMRLELRQIELDSLHSNVLFFIQNCLTPEFSDFSVTFKCHNLLHYRQFIESYGPLWMYCTLRFERFHQKLLRLISQSQNRVNRPQQVINWYLTGEAIDTNTQNNDITVSTDKIDFKIHKFYILNTSYTDFDSQPRFGKLVKLATDTLHFELYQIVKFDSARLYYKVRPSQEPEEVLDPSLLKLCFITLPFIHKPNSSDVILFKTI